ncbi:MAG: hypothetical protein HA489_06190 [Archaeoglobales archaeon]|jgi:hypothetical protein|nr:hypothetical protein [Archaeoglobi archaeon]NHW23820.1 hypothetical protein [Archaeoglobales archaeon]TDA26874.1 MAG: hypothetical protein DSO01_04525 [Archaeoglobi archaeon]TDA30211.1 MAG: hypothetical protein DSO00_02080 [Archaeoglobi archaeon]
MDEFDFLDEEEEEVVEGEDGIKLAEIYKLTMKLLKLLEDLKSVELKESTSLMLIRELVGEDKVLLGLASKMLQDISLGLDGDEYVI